MPRAPFLSLLARSARMPLVGRLLADGVSVSPGEQFGSDFVGHARICFSAVPLDRLRVGLERLAQHLA